jgi:hypothetical protein
MRCKQEVIEPDRRLWRIRMSICILRTDGGRVQKARCGYGIAGEAEDVEGGEIDGESEGRFAEVVMYRLGVEGGAPVIYSVSVTMPCMGSKSVPAQEVHPSQHSRNCFRKCFELTVGHDRICGSSCGLSDGRSDAISTARVAGLFAVFMRRKHSRCQGAIITEYTRGGKN